MPTKSSPLDVIPASLIKSCNDIISHLANLSFSAGRFPLRYKTVQVLPLLKRPEADGVIPLKYRPMSNLATVSKMLERLELIQLWPHLFGSVSMCRFQSAYRTRHSTETALLELLNDVYTVCDRKQFTVVAGMDIAGAFNTVDHRILLDRLVLVEVVPVRLQTVREGRPLSFEFCRLRSWCAAGISARSPPVRGVCYTRR